MDAQRKAALRLRALGGDEAALDELLNVLTAQKDTAIAQKDAAIAIAEQTVLAAIRTLGSLWSVHDDHGCANLNSIPMHTILRTHVHVQDGRECYGRGCRTGGAGAQPVVHTGGWHPDPGRLACCPEDSRADSHRLGPAVDSGGMAWRTLLDDPCSSHLRDLVLRFYIFRGCLYSQMTLPSCSSSAR